MNYKLLELLVPVLIRLLELLLSREEEKDDKQLSADVRLADATRKKYRNKSDDEIIEEAFA